MSSNRTSKSKPKASAHGSSKAMVRISDDPLRRIASGSWHKEGENKDDKTVKVAAIPIGSPVWYITKTPKKSRTWYVPARVSDYVPGSGEGRSIKGYVLKVNQKSVRSGFAKKKNQNPLEEGEWDIHRQLRCADPTNVVLRWDKSIPRCPVPGIEFDNSEKTARKKKFVSDFDGAKQNGLGPEMWGITLKQLQDIIKDKRFKKSVYSQYAGRESGGMSMYDVVEKVIKPKTKGRGMGYALLINRDKPRRARVMISHAWGEDYEHFVKSLEESDVEGPFWVCAMSIYQNEDIKSMTIEKQLGSAPSRGPFTTVVKQAERMVVVLTPEVDVYTRLWCVYEIYVAISNKVPVKLAFFSERTGYLGSGQTYHNPLVDNCGQMINTSVASCGYKHDERYIRSEVKKRAGGFHEIDDVVSWVRVKALADDGLFAASEETVWDTPIGVCSASCAEARVNAAIAISLDLWRKAQHARKRR